jgi:hypothetical protein
MDIQFLRLHLTDHDLRPVAARLAAQADGIDELSVRLTPDGVAAGGKYPTPFGFKVAFETLWEVTADGPDVRSRLVSLKVAGVTAGLLRGALMKMVRDAVEGLPGVSVVDDSVILRVEEAAKAHGVELRVRWTAIRMKEGECIVEAGERGT